MQRRVIPEYSFIIPVLNERETIPELHRRLDAVMAQLDGPAEIVFVVGAVRQNARASRA